MRNKVYSLSFLMILTVMQKPSKKRYQQAEAAGLRDAQNRGSHAEMPPRAAGPDFCLASPTCPQRHVPVQGWWC